MSALLRAVPHRRQTGLSLVESLVFIVVVGAAVAGVLAAFNVSVQRGADPLVRKHLLAIAESLLEEVELMPFTYCDPDDANARTAASPADCTTAEGPGPEVGESRYGGGGVQFDNVNDYHGYNTATESPSGIKDIGGTAIAALANYNATVTVVNRALGTIPAGDAVLITVTVSGPGGATVTLQGYRMRYAPNATP